VTGGNATLRDRSGVGGSGQHGTTAARAATKGGKQVGGVASRRYRGLARSFPSPTTPFLRIHVNMGAKVTKGIPYEEATQRRKFCRRVCC